VAALLLCSLPAAAQQRLLTLDDLYDPQKRVDFNGAPPVGLTWISDTHYLAPQPATGGGTQLVKVDAATGRSEPLFDADRMQAALARLPGIAPEEARRLARQRSYEFNDSRTAVLLTTGGDLYYYELGGDRAVRLTSTPEEEEEASFSPDGRVVAFVRGHNLYVVDVVQGRERALTTDGTEQILNGKLDWVYQEEIYGRGNFRGYWFSPDSTRIAFLQLNEHPVPEFTVVDDIPYRLELETWDYPKAGDPNPTVRLGIAQVAGGARWVDTTKYAPIDHLIVGVGWTPSGRDVIYNLQDREQTWLDANLADAASGETRTLFRETTRAWVSPEETGSPTWLKDGSFLWFSERDGFRHLYHYSADGKLLRQVTDGPWEVRAIHGVDERAEGGGWIYFSGTERSAIGRDVYRIRLDGRDLSRLSKTAGTHAARFSAAYSFYIDAWSDVTTPTQVRLHRSDGSELRVIDANPVAALGQFRLSKPELLQVKTRDGFVMEAMMIKPPGFDPTRKYPVFHDVYGGPHSQTVVNRWGGSSYMYYQLLAQRGIIVWLCDNRTASGKGAQSAWPVYRNFGELELRDIEDGVTWLKSQPYVDGSRIGVNGWSYGGFLVSYALTHSRSFAMGIAGGTVSDWRAYDTIYTERYMGMPQNNAEGYRKSSPRFAAAGLSGNLLLLHGTMDDNVHLQNTLQLAYELQKANKPFRLMLYPRSRHGVSDPALVRHLRGVMLDFTLENLRPEGAVPQTAERLPR
jgi:dipeptidyl-peptidase-4